MVIENLHVLISIVDSGSIQSAARKLGLSRSLLRRRLEGLEAAVGVPLLHRDAVGVRLTAAGAVVVEQGRPLMEGSRLLLSEARAAAGEGTGVIRAFEPVGLPVRLRTYGLLATRGALPKLRLVVRQVEDPLAHINEPCEMLLHPGDPPEGNLWFSRVLVRHQLRALASPDYLRAKGEPKTPADLAHHEILGWRTPRQAVDSWPLLAGGTVDVAPWFVSPDWLLVRTLAAEGGGIVFAPVPTPFLDEPGAKPLVTVLEDQIGAEVVLRASSRDPSRADSRTRDALEYIQRTLERLFEA